MDHWLWILLAALLLKCRAQPDNVEQPEGDETETEGETLTLDCHYNSSGTNNYLYWYKQDGNNSPKFILSRFTYGEGKTMDEFKERFSSTLNSNDRSVPLKIQKLQLSDSAVYYCALNTGGYGKFLFGSGTKVTVEPKEVKEPSYYKLDGGEDGPSVCLASGFTRHNKVKEGEESKDLFGTTEAVLSEGEKMYSQVAFINTTDDKCDQLAGESAGCNEGLKPDPTVNVVSLTLLGLRIIFLKTIVFNVLMTLRLWMSQ